MARHARRAARLGRRLAARFGLPGVGLLRARPVPGAGIATLWPFANALAALCALAGTWPARSASRDEAVERLEHAVAALDAYRRGPGAYCSVVLPPLGPGGDLYFDDNAWVGLALLHEHDLTGAVASLERAAAIFELLARGWSDEEGWAHPGGIRWAEPAWSTGRTACSNAPAAALALRLYLLGGATRHLEWGRRLYGWVRRSLLTPAQLYADQIAPDGRVDGRIYSYNQGAMIGAGVLLARASGRHRHLEEAASTARACLARLRAVRALDQQGPAFNAILARNLLLLDAARPVPEAADLVRRYAARLWRRQLAGNLAASLNGAAAPIALNALLAGSAPTP
ncbi:MAG TPA: glycoside hydrolase family 76 protein [Acidimicrobiales bacterium]|nr:glycoside hydrolase family 76 protein [Acidimicrobiales bacterium]